jgi:L-serine dehydratase
MTTSLFDLFSIWIGPSSSHTVGPMRAARTFVSRLAERDALGAVHRVRCELYGSLGATGRGHGSDNAVVLGLLGHTPELIDPDLIAGLLDQVRISHALALLGEHDVEFDLATDVILNGKVRLALHPNGMTMRAFDAAGATVAEESYFSIGGGFVVDETAQGEDPVVSQDAPLPYPFRTAADLLDQCERHHLSMSEVMLANECAMRPEAEVREGIVAIWRAMQECVARGCSSAGTLPGGLKVQRRAPQMAAALHAQSRDDPLRGMDWISMYALAVNEENAAGGRVVTAPTNGAAGIVPAVLHYAMRFLPGTDETETPIRFLLTAAAIGVIYTQTASISGAEVGCQGEVGSACSMAAAGMAQIQGGTPQQVEDAAEIGLEHNLGLTCDPVGGLVQIPCIERNAVAAIKAVAASRTALIGDGAGIVTLDQVIKTMRDTGADMQDRYKETSLGGLAVNVTEC